MQVRTECFMDSIPLFGSARQPPTLFEGPSPSCEDGQQFSPPSHKLKPLKDQMRQGSYGWDGSAGTMGRQSAPGSVFVRVFTRTRREEAGQPSVADVTAVRPALEAGSLLRPTTCLGAGPAHATGSGGSCLGLTPTAVIGERPVQPDVPPLLARPA